jgi:hypothetical protein
VREPHHLALYWIPAQQAPLPTPELAQITIRACGSGIAKNSDVTVLGTACCTTKEIDYLIDDIIKDLEFARQQAHERFER